MKTRETMSSKMTNKELWVAISRMTYRELHDFAQVFIEAVDLAALQSSDDLMRAFADICDNLENEGALDDER